MEYCDHSEFTRPILKRFEHEFGLYKGQMLEMTVIAKERRYTETAVYTKPGGTTTRDKGSSLHPVTLDHGRGV